MVTTTCVAMLESGFTDPDGDGKFGNSPVTVDLNGLVMAPCILFLIQIIYYCSSIVITTYYSSPTCELQNAQYINNGIFTNGNYLPMVQRNDIVNNAPYSNATTNTLTITSVTNGMNGFKYRVQLNKRKFMRFKFH
jgi:hypothetical protein